MTDDILHTFGNNHEAKNHGYTAVFFHLANCSNYAMFCTKHLAILEKKVFREWTIVFIKNVDFNQYFFLVYMFALIALSILY